MPIIFFFIIALNFYISFKLSFGIKINFFSDVIIVRISHTYRMSWYGFLLCPITYNFGYIINICYCINFRSWMKYCDCWSCDNILLGVFIPIPISVYLYITKQLCFNNQFPRSYNLSVNYCVVLKCICFWCEHDKIKSICCCVSCVNGTIFS